MCVRVYKRPGSYVTDTHKAQSQGTLNDGIHTWMNAMVLMVCRLLVLIFHTDLST